MVYNKEAAKFLPAGSFIVFHLSICMNEQKKNISISYRTGEDVPGVSCRICELELEEDIFNNLEQAAAKLGTSTEELIRSILETTLSQPEAAECLLKAEKKDPDPLSGIRIIRSFPVLASETENAARERALREEKESRG